MLNGLCLVDASVMSNKHTFNLTISFFVLLLKGTCHDVLIDVPFQLLTAMLTCNKATSH